MAARDLSRVSLRANSRVICAIAAVILMVGGSWRVHAQAAASPAAASTAPATTSVSAASSAAKMFARYEHPGQCVKAAERTQGLYWRDKRPDTLLYRPLTDTMPTVAVAAARSCAARFTLADVPVRDLPDLVALYLWIGQDSLADATAARLLATPRTVLATQAGWDQPGWLLRVLVGTALSVRPVRMAMAQRYLRQLDTIRAVSAAPWRMQAYQWLANHALTVGDLTAGRDAANTAIRAGHAMERSEQIDRVYEMADVYDLLAEPVSLLANGPAALAVFDTARARLSPLRAPGTSGRKGGSQPDPSAALDDMMRQSLGMPVEAAPPGGLEAMELMRLQAFIESLRQPYTLVSVAAPPIVATHWYPTPSDTAARPRKGVVTLVFSANANCGGSCYSQYAVLRRLQASYGSRGLQIVMLAPTQGFFRNQPQPDPARESEQASHYLLDFVKLPGVLGVEETKFSFRPDGMRLNMFGDTRRDYFKGRSAIVVGKDGVVREVVRLDTYREQMLRDVIAAALQ